MRARPAHSAGIRQRRAALLQEARGHAHFWIYSANSLGIKNTPAGTKKELCAYTQLFCLSWSYPESSSMSFSISSLERIPSMEFASERQAAAEPQPNARVLPISQLL